MSRARFGAVNESEAVALQESLRERVDVSTGLARPPELVAGVDVSYAVGDDRLVAAIAVLAFPSLELAELVTVAGVAEFPYIPGLLGFREVPILLEAMKKLTVTPDVFVCDGYGIAHPRRFGLACHLGVVTGIAAFGVGKTAFVGTFSEPAPQRGATADLVHEGEVVGRAVRTQPGVKPVFVSAGHLIDLDTSVALTLQLAPRYRLPETTRFADHASREALVTQRLRSRPAA